MGIIGLPMFFRDILDPWLFGLFVLGSVVLGLIVFYVRQKQEQDDGFLAVMIYSTMALFRGENAAARAELETSVPRDSVRRHWLFAAAARKFDELTAEGPQAVLRIISVFILVSFFWALFDQHASSWVRQATRMDLNVWFFGRTITLLPSQISAMNPLIVMALIPLNNFLIYPFIDRFFLRLTPLRKMTLGMFTASAAFVIVAVLQSRIDTSGAGTVNVMWQFFPYLFMTQAEVMVSITGLEFAYTQAPSRMKSTIMGFWLLTVALGNQLVVVVTKLPEMSLLRFFWIFAGLMAAAAFLFSIRAAFYRYKDYTQ
jgi:POT family proton-dependent oligopeptide transporter